jgi:hypothetical protein
MAVTTYKAWIKLPNGSKQEIRVQADSHSNAQAMLEAQYGKSNVGVVTRA